MTKTRISPSTSPIDTPASSPQIMGQEPQEKTRKSKSNSSSPVPSKSLKKAATASSTSLSSGRRRKSSSASSTTTLSTNTATTASVKSTKSRSRSKSDSNPQTIGKSQSRKSSLPSLSSHSKHFLDQPSAFPEKLNRSSTRSTLRTSSSGVARQEKDSIVNIHSSIIVNPGEYVSDDVDLESHSASLHQGDTDVSAPVTPLVEPSSLHNHDRSGHQPPFVSNHGSTVPVTLPPQPALTRSSHFGNPLPGPALAPLVRHNSVSSAYNDRRLCGYSAEMHPDIHQTTNSLGQNPNRFSFQPRSSLLGPQHQVMMHPRAAESRTSASILASLILPPSPSHHFFRLQACESDSEFDPSAPVDLSPTNTHLHLVTTHTSPFPTPKRQNPSPSAEYGSLTVLGYGAAITRLAPHSTEPPVVTYKPSQRLRLCRRDHPNGLFFTPPRYMTSFQRFYQTTLRNHATFRLLYRLTHCTAETPDAVKQITIKALPASEDGSLTGSTPSNGILPTGQEYSAQGDMPASSSKRASFLSLVVPPPVDAAVQTTESLKGDSLSRPHREPSVRTSVSSRAPSQLNTVPPIQSLTPGVSSTGGTIGPSSPTAETFQGDDGYLVYSSIPDFNYDQFQFGKSRGNDLDFVVPGYTVIRSSKPDQCSSPIDGTEPSTGSCTLSRIDTVCQQDVLISQRNRYPFRIVCHRSNPTWVYLFAGALDDQGSLECDSDTLRWSDTRVPGGIDAFPSGSGVLLWKPESISPESPNGVWMEVSVMGNVFHLRPDTQTRGEPIESFSKTRENIGSPTDRRYSTNMLLSSAPLNMLSNGSLIYASGMTFLWTSSAPSLSSPSSGTTSVYPTNSMMQVPQVNGKEQIHVNLVTGDDDKNVAVCPVTRGGLPDRYLAHSVRFDRISVPQWLYDQLPWLKWSRLPNPLLQSEMCEKRPWVFQECGHVFSRYDPRIPIKGHTGTCSVCHTFGPFVPLIIRPVPELVHGPPDTMLVPCGHAMDYAQANFWFRVALVPRPPADPELAEIDSLVGPNPIASYLEVNQLTVPRRSASRPQSYVSVQQNTLSRMNESSRRDRSSFSLKRFSANLSQLGGNNSHTSHSRPPSIVGVTTLGRSTPALVSESPYPGRSRHSVLSNKEGLLTAPIVRINNPLFYTACPFCRKEILNVKRLIFCSYEEIPSTNESHHFSSVNPTTTTFESSPVASDSDHRHHRTEVSQPSYSQQAPHRRRSSSVAPKVRSRSNSRARETNVLHISEELSELDTAEQMIKPSQQPRSRSRRSSSVTTGDTVPSSSTRSRRRSSSRPRGLSNAIPESILTAPTSAAIVMTMTTPERPLSALARPNQMTNAGLLDQSPFRRTSSFLQGGTNSSIPTSPRWSLSETRRISSSADMAFIPPVESIASVTSNLPF